MCSNDESSAVILQKFAIHLFMIMFVDSANCFP